MHRKLRHIRICYWNRSKFTVLSWRPWIECHLAWQFPSVFTLNSSFLANESKLHVTSFPGSYPTGPYGPRVRKLVGEDTENEFELCVKKAVCKLLISNIELLSVLLGCPCIILRSPREKLELTSKSIHWHKGTYQNIGSVALSCISSNALSRTLGKINIIWKTYKPSLSEPLRFLQGCFKLVPWAFVTHFSNCFDFVSG